MIFYDLTEKNEKFLLFYNLKLHEFVPLRANISSIVGKNEEEENE